MGTLTSVPAKAPRMPILASSPMRRMPWSNALWLPLTSPRNTATESRATDRAWSAVPKVSSETWSANTTSSAVPSTAHAIVTCRSTRTVRAIRSLVARADRFGDLAHAAAVDAELRGGAGQVGDEAKAPISPKPAGPSSTAMRLGAHHGDDRAEQRGAADQRRRTQDLAVAVALGGNRRRLRTVGGVCVRVVRHGLSRRGRMARRGLDRWRA